MIFGVPLRAPTELTKRQTDIFLVTSGYRWLWETLYSKWSQTVQTDTQTYKTYTLYIDHHVCCIDSLVPSPHLPHIENASQLSRAHLGEKNASQKLWHSNKNKNSDFPLWLKGQAPSMLLLPFKDSALTKLYSRYEEIFLTVWTLCNLISDKWINE